ncbi:hypothetical protein [Streptomyces sp. JH34]|uniref:hypothetical protein n=1 Tax=unclassified Streptomyces TaxID=2593676 RepID=UPI0023F801E1|nr:hypothetical protein [Streptomyces sp. JH34]MDF6021310.1 hypothetical protein [Streptomyces sp. JH34]
MRRKTENSEAELFAPEAEALAEAVRGRVEPEGAERALAAFREFRAAEGAGPQRPRRRDDWRPSRRSPASVSLRAALGAALATVALGGVALAVGTGALSGPFGEADDDVRRPQSPPVVDAPRTPGGGRGETGRPSSAPTASPSDRAPVPRSHAALCAAWGKGNGKHLGKAFRRLADAAGGEAAVPSYCAASAGASGTPTSSTGNPGGRTAPGQSKKSPAASSVRGRGAEHARGAGADE